MAVSNVAITDTFYQWLVKTNQVIVEQNKITEGVANLTSAINFSNPNFYNSNSTISVSNGHISIQGNVFLANAVSLVSNSATLTITGTGRLGTTVYFDIGTLSTDVNDRGVANIASANTVNVAHSIATFANAAAIAAFSQANNANATAISGYDTANAAFAKANTAGGGYFKGNQGDVGQASNKGDIFRINTSNVTSNIYFTAGENAMAAGPLYLDSGITLTINTGARVVIV